MTRLAEYADVKGAVWSQREVVATAMGKTEEYSLVHATAGWECAGAVARWTDEYWAVRSFWGNAWHSTRFTTEAAARETFAKWTTPGKAGAA